MPAIAMVAHPFNAARASSSEHTTPTLTGLTAEEKVFGPYRELVFTFSNVAVALTDVAATVAYGGAKIIDFAEGAVTILGACSALAITKSSAGVNADFDGDFGIGTVTASNNATLSSTEQNVIPTTATPQAVAGATTAKGVATAAVFLDGTTTPIDLFLNFLVDDADQDVTTTPCSLIVNGTVTIQYLWQGNH